MDEFTFDEKTHTYRLRGQPLLGVTDVLVDQGFIVPKFFKEEHRIRGSRVHLLCQFYDEGDYDPKEAERFGLAGYVESWIKLRKKCGFEVLMNERRGYHRRQLYAGTLDRVVRFPEGWPALLDLKSGIEEHGHPFQTGGYDEILKSEGDIAARRRGCVYLKADGSYPFVEWHEDPFDGPNFLALAQASNLRRMHGVTAFRG